MKYDAWFQCFDGCGERYPLTEIVYRCRKCDSLLEVAHDVEALKRRSASAWMQVFQDRYMTTAWPYGSGVWGKKELIYPQIDDDNIVSIMEGGTNMFWAERFGDQIGLEDLWVKQSGNSHTGSFKDLGMTVLVSAVKQIISEGGSIEAVMCASTGDTSASVAAYCAAAGIPAVVLLPKDKVSPAQLIQPISNGALTLALDTDFDGCMAIVQRLSEDKRFYLANSINPLRIEGQKTLSMELVQQDDWQVPDWVVVPGGNLGNITAIGLGFLMMLDLGLIQKLPRLVCAQAAQANPLYKSYLNGFKSFEAVHAEPTLATAIQIGNPVSAPKAIPILKRFERHRRAGHRGRARPRSRHGRQDRAVHMPSDRRGAGRAAQAPRPRRDRVRRQGDRRLDGPRPQVQRVQDRLPHRRAPRGGAPARQPARRAARRLRLRRQGHRRRNTVVPGATRRSTPCPGG